MHKFLYIALLFVALHTVKAQSQERFSVEALHNTTEYIPNSQHSIIVEITSRIATTDSLIADIKLPPQWKLITRSTIGALPARGKKLILISFSIPQDFPPGEAQAEFLLRNTDYTTIQTQTITFNVPTHRELNVNLVNAPEQLQAGESYTAMYAVENKGNTTENVDLFSKYGNVVGQTNMNLEPGSITYVEVQQESNTKIFSIHNLSSELQVLPTNSEEVYKARHSAKVFPTKIKAKDQFFRFPIEASYIYHSYFSNVRNHFSISSFEILGNGYLDTENTQHLNFVFRGPNHIKRNRFRMLDQYSATYRNENTKTQVMLGDYGLRVNNLALSGRYGFGARVDQEINKWTVSAFYTKPRFYENNKPIYGGQFSYKVLDSLKIGASVVATKGRISAYRNTEDRDAQIITLESEYHTKNTKLQFETSASITNNKTDFANYLRFSQRFGRVRYSGNIIYTGKEYMGSIYNSFAVANSININLGRKSNLSFGQRLSRVNERLDELTYTTLPYYERYFMEYRLRLNNQSFMNLRFTKRIREDKLEPKNYYYKENILRYTYRYTNRIFSLNFNGRYGQSKNLLIDNSGYRNTYGTGLGLSYRYQQLLTFKGSVQHTHTSKYSTRNTATNYIGYSLGFDLNISNHFRFNFNYNNSFNPELSYTTRDYISANLNVKLTENHKIELRTNYYSNPGVIDYKEFYGFGKYTYSFGAPLKRTTQLGGLKGTIDSNLKNIDLKGIAINSSSATVKTNAFGSFEINNLPIGTNYIFIDQATLPENVIVAKKMPLEVIVSQDELTDVEIPLVKSANLSGTLDFTRGSNTYKLNAFIKLENDSFTYYTESSANGNFKFNSIVPGNYKLTVLKMKDSPKAFNAIPVKNVLAKSGENVKVSVVLSEKNRNVKFKNTNFKVKL